MLTYAKGQREYNGLQCNPDNLFYFNIVVFFNLLIHYPLAFLEPFYLGNEPYSQEERFVLPPRPGSVSPTEQTKGRLTPNLQKQYSFTTFRSLSTGK